MEEKLLNPFIFNLCNLSNLLKHQLIKNIEELVLRFDIPLPLINNQKYRIVIIKFIFDILIMLTFQDNRTNTFKILAPNLEINSNKTMSFSEIITNIDKEHITHYGNFENLKSAFKTFLNNLPFFPILLAL